MTACYLVVNKPLPSLAGFRVRQLVATVGSLGLNKIVLVPQQYININYDSIFRPFSFYLLAKNRCGRFGMIILFVFLRNKYEIILY